MFVPQLQAGTGAGRRLGDEADLKMPARWQATTTRPTGP